MGSTYIYSPLPSAYSIRLFKLESRDSGALLEGTLTTVSLSDPGLSFKALSYTWGNPLDEDSLFFKPYDSSKHYVACSGKSIEIMENLQDALWQLRQLQEFSYLWIDAICINQKDNDEKSQQIKLMSDLYSTASWVIIWLGKSDPTSDEAIGLIGTGLDASFMSLMAQAYQTPSNEHASTGMQFESLTPQKWQAIANLLLRKWFSRLWTLQEILLPTRTIAICGSQRFHIDEATLLAAALLRTNRHLSMFNIARPAQTARATARLYAAASIGAWLGCSWAGGGFGTRAFLRYPKIDYELKIPRIFKWLVALEVLVHETRQRECSDSKDKIIAPLAFAMKYAPTGGYGQLEGCIKDLLDYLKSTDGLYRKFTRFMIDSMSNLDILSRVDRYNGVKYENELNLPSWVPYFNVAGTSSLIDDLLFTKFDAAKYLGPRRNNEGKAKRSLNLGTFVLTACRITV
jgi:hypothetical protein